MSARGKAAARGSVEVAVRERPECPERAKRAVTPVAPQAKRKVKAAVKARASPPKPTAPRKPPAATCGGRNPQELVTELLRAAGECAVRGDAAGAMDALRRYVAVRQKPRPDADSLARGAWRALGRLPADHVIPGRVGTAAEFLRVLAANQDSPQRELDANYHVSYCGSKYAPLPNDSRDGHVRVKLRVSAILNYGVEQEGAETLTGDDITGRYCVWEDPHFAAVLTGSSGFPTSAEQRESVVRESGRALLFLCRMSEQAKSYGFSWPGRRDVIEYTVRQYTSLKVPVPAAIRGLTLA